MDRKEARPAAGSSSFSGCTNTLQLRFNVSIHENYLPCIRGRRNAWEREGGGWRTNICLHLTGLMMVGRVEEFIARLGCSSPTTKGKKETRWNYEAWWYPNLSDSVKWHLSLSFSCFGSLFNSVLQLKWMQFKSRVSLYTRVSWSWVVLVKFLFLLSRFSRSF